MITDWLGAGPLLQQAIQTALPALGPVRIVASIQEAQALVLTTPACFVCWAGDVPFDMAGRGSVTAVTQKWMVVIARRAGESVGETLSSLISSLGGALLSDAYDEFRFAGSGGAVFDGTHVFYPLYFSTAVFAA
jgi:hypothetical protein